MKNFTKTKKVVLLSLLCLIGITAANAQSSSSKFGGKDRTLSVGIQGGLVGPVTATGGTNDFRYWDATTAWGLTIQKQLVRAFGLELSGQRGTIEGNNNNNTNHDDVAYMTQTNRTRFVTDLDYSAMLSGIVNVATLKDVNFIVKAGYGMIWYAPQINTSRTFFTAISGQGGFPSTTIDYKGKAGDSGTDTYFKGQVIPIGAGVKFKIFNRVKLDMGYNMYFTNKDNFDGTSVGDSKDKYSWAYTGLEFNITKNSKK